MNIRGSGLGHARPAESGLGLRTAPRGGRKRDEMMTITKLDADADSMKAGMNTERRRLEAEHGTMLCATRDCPREAADGSCYCEPCEDAID